MISKILTNVIAAITTHNNNQQLLKENIQQNKTLLLNESINDSQFDAINKSVFTDKLLDTVSRGFQINDTSYIVNFTFTAEEIRNKISSIKAVSKKLNALSKIRTPVGRIRPNRDELMYIPSDNAEDSEETRRYKQQDRDKISTKPYDLKFDDPIIGYGFTDNNNNYSLKPSETFNKQCAANGILVYKNDNFVLYKGSQQDTSPAEQNSNNIFVWGKSLENAIADMSSNITNYTKILTPTQKEKYNTISDDNSEEKQNTLNMFHTMNKARINATISDLSQIVTKIRQYKQMKDNKISNDSLQAAKNNNNNNGTYEIDDINSAEYSFTNDIPKSTTMTGREKNNIINKYISNNIFDDNDINKILSTPKVILFVGKTDELANDKNNIIMMVSYTAKFNKENGLLVYDGYKYYGNNESEENDILTQVRELMIEFKYDVKSLETYKKAREDNNVDDADYPSNIETSYDPNNDDEKNKNKYDVELFDERINKFAKITGVTPSEILQLIDDKFAKMKSNAMRLRLITNAISMFFTFDLNTIFKISRNKDQLMQILLSWAPELNKKKGMRLASSVFKYIDANGVSNDTIPLRDKINEYEYNNTPVKNTADVSINDADEIIKSFLNISDDTNANNNTSIVQPDTLWRNTIDELDNMKYIFGGDSKYRSYSNEANSSVYNKIRIAISKNIEDKIEATENAPIKELLSYVSSNANITIKSIKSTMAELLKKSPDNEKLKYVSNIINRDTSEAESSLTDISDYSPSHFKFVINKAIYSALGLNLKSTVDSKGPNDANIKHNEQLINDIKTSAGIDKLSDISISDKQIENIYNKAYNDILNKTHPTLSTNDKINKVSNKVIQQKFKKDIDMRSVNIELNKMESMDNDEQIYEYAKQYIKSNNKALHILADIIVNGHRVISLDDAKYKLKSVLSQRKDKNISTTLVNSELEKMKSMNKDQQFNYAKNNIKSDDEALSLLSKIIINNSPFIKFADAENKMRTTLRKLFTPTIDELIEYIENNEDDELKQPAQSAKHQWAPPKSEPIRGPNKIRSSNRDSGFEFKPLDRTNAAKMWR